MRGAGFVSFITVHCVDSVCMPVGCLDLQCNPGGKIAAIKHLEQPCTQFPFPAYTVHIHCGTCGAFPDYIVNTLVMYSSAPIWPGPFHNKSTAHKLFLTRKLISTNYYLIYMITKVFCEFTQQFQTLTRELLFCDASACLSFRNCMQESK